jgi:hypothetical protein
MELKTFLHSKNGRILMSVLLGIGISTLFRKVCKDRNCLVFKAPQYEKIKDKIFKFDNKCYTYKDNIKQCDKNKQIVEFEII